MFHSQCLKRTSLALAAWLTIVLTMSGCAQTPHVYTMQPAKLEAIRADLSTIGVCVVPGPQKTEVLRPARGVWGGLKRGIVVGATLPVMIGFVSPVPGGSFLGLLASPLGAVIGAIYGIFTAVPAAEIDHAEVMLAMAADNIRSQGLREDFVDAVVELGNRHTRFKFVEWPETVDMETSRPLQAQRDIIGARLAIRVERTGLRGIYHVDPPTDTFLQIRVQLVDLRNDAILLDEQFICASDEERSFQRWADQAGADLIDEFRDCVPELAEKIVDDLFRVYPVRWSDGAAF